MSAKSTKKIVTTHSFWANASKEKTRERIASMKKDISYLKRMNTGLSKKITSYEAKLKDAKYAYKYNLGRIKTLNEFIEALSNKLKKM